jgi:hypothetical protein
LTNKKFSINYFMYRYSELGEIMTQKYRPGEKAPASGQYEIVGSRGGRTGKERTVTRGEPMPPTPQGGQGYILVDPTKNGSGKAK